LFDQRLHTGDGIGKLRQQPNSNQLLEALLASSIIVHDERSEQRQRQQTP
jgi:hypothetical protein